MTMNELLQRINQLLEFNGYDVMWEYPEGSDSKKAEEYVKQEYKAFTKAIEAREKSLQGPVRPPAYNAMSDIIGL